MVQTFGRMEIRQFELRIRTGYAAGSQTITVGFFAFTKTGQQSQRQRLQKQQGRQLRTKVRHQNYEQRFNQLWFIEFK